MASPGQKPGHRGEHERALALHAALPDGAAIPPFARSRRANGLAYGHHLRGDGARARAAVIAEALDDDVLRRRCAAAVVG